MPNEMAQFQEVERFMGSLPATLAASGFSLNALRPYYPSRKELAANGGRIAPNALLRKDEWKVLDTRIVDVARQRLVAVNDLRSRGLVFQAGDLGTLVAEYEKLSDMTEADLDMAGVTGGEKDTVKYDLVGVPIPIIHKDYSLNIRRLLSSRRLGNSLDTTQAQVAARLVADRIESVLFLGAGMVVDGLNIYGYTTHPDRNTGTADGDFGTLSNVFPTINAMVMEAEAANYYGPYVLYVSSIQYGEMRLVYSDGSGQSAIERTLKAIPQLSAIQPADSLTDENLVLVTMVPDVVDIAIAQEVTNVQWEELGGMIQNFKVMAAMAPRVKSDSNGNSGIVHYTGA